MTLKVPVKHRQVCLFIEETSEFEDADGNNSDIRKGVINSNTGFTVYKFHCSFCFKQYVGSNITDFRYPFSKYKGAFRKVFKSGKPSKVNREHFHQHFEIPEDNDMGSWKVVLIDRVDNRKKFRRQKCFWQYKLNTFYPNQRRSFQPLAIITKRSILDIAAVLEPPLLTG